MEDPPGTSGKHSGPPQWTPEVGPDVDLDLDLDLEVFFFFFDFPPFLGLFVL